jgi:hypothetical protein
MTVRILHDDLIPVSYGQFYVIGDEDDLDLPESFAGQQNGLCGAAIEAGLFLITGTHTGQVRLTVELHDAPAPPAAQEWEEVVEVSFRSGGEVQLAAWGGDGEWPLDLLPDSLYRVRYCALGMDRSREAVLSEADYDLPAKDRYLLQFWPAGREEPDAVLRQTSAAAAYWHDCARKQPPPPTAQQRAEKERLERLERERQAAEYRRRDELRRWGGREPSERLRRVGGGNVLGIVRLDRDLVDAVAEADAGTQRRVAHWAARHAYEYAGIADEDWVVPVWGALERGEPLPPPFDDAEALWRRVFPGELRFTGFVSFGPPAKPVEIHPVAAAVPALLAAVEADPLQAALEALWAAAVAYGGDVPAFLVKVREAFPELS